MRLLLLILISAFASACGHTSVDGGIRYETFPHSLAHYEAERREEHPGMAPQDVTSNARTDRSSDCLRAWDRLYAAHQHIPGDRRELQELMRTWVRDHESHDYAYRNIVADVGGGEIDWSDQETYFDEIPGCVRELRRLELSRLHGETRVVLRVIDEGLRHHVVTGAHIWRGGFDYAWVDGEALADGVVITAAGDNAAIAVDVEFDALAEPTHVIRGNYRFDTEHLDGDEFIVTFTAREHELSAMEEELNAEIRAGFEGWHYCKMSHPRPILATASMSMDVETPTRSWAQSGYDPESIVGQMRSQIDHCTGANR